MTTLIFTCKSFSPAALEQVFHFLGDVVTCIGLPPLEQSSLPRRVRRITVLRSPHIYKKSREQFQLQRHTRLYRVLLPCASAGGDLYALLCCELVQHAHLVGVEVQITLSMMDTLPSPNSSPAQDVNSLV